MDSPEHCGADKDQTASMCVPQATLSELCSNMIVVPALLEVDVALETEIK